MRKKLKIWNGRSPVYWGKFDRGHVFVAAYSQKQAAELVSEAMGAYCTVSEIRDYFSPGAWGNSMSHIEPVEPCVYAQTKDRTIPPERLK